MGIWFRGSRIEVRTAAELEAAIQFLQQRAVA